MSPIYHGWTPEPDHKKTAAAIAQRLRELLGCERALEIVRDCIACSYTTTALTVALANALMDAEREMEQQ